MELSISRVLGPFRVKDDQFSAVKQSLGQNALPAHLILGLPADYVSEQVEEFCHKLGWSVQVDPLSRRFRNRRLQWVVRASSAPPINSAYCFTGYTRLRIDIESAVRQRSPSPPPRVEIDDFQTLTFFSKLRGPELRLVLADLLSGSLLPLLLMLKLFLGRSRRPLLLSLRLSVLKRIPCLLLKALRDIFGPLTLLLGLMPLFSLRLLGAFTHLLSLLLGTMPLLRLDQHMLSQIMERLAPMPAPAAASTAGDVPDTDPDSYMTSGVEGGEFDIHTLFS